MKRCQLLAVAKQYFQKRVGFPFLVVCKWKRDGSRNEGAGQTGKMDNQAATLIGKKGKLAYTRRPIIIVTAESGERRVR